MNTYKQLLRPLLFRLDAEVAHNMSRATLRRTFLIRWLGAKSRFVQDARLQVEMGGLTLQNPVGLAAGFDKDCDMLAGLMSLGFGFVVAGSVMCHPRPGNPRPRMVRDPQREALYSCMGLPSRGLEYAVGQLKGRPKTGVPLIINLNAENFEEYLLAFKMLEPHGDALEVSLFCPNRPQDAGDFLSPAGAEPLLAEICKYKQKPLFIKIPGYRTESERRERLDLVSHILKYSVAGITITPESRVEEPRLSIGRGTITGKPTFQQMLRVVKDVYRLTGDRVHIKAAGGIMTPQDAFAAIAAGASAVEAVTGFFYEGWNMARNINRGLCRLLTIHRIQNVQALRGSKA